LLPSSHPASIESIVSVADWYGTFAKLAKVDDFTDLLAKAAGLPPVDSIDLWPLISGATDQPARDELVLQYHLYNESGMIAPEVQWRNGTKLGVRSAFVSGKYKLIGRDPIKGSGRAEGSLSDVDALELRSGWSTRELTAVSANAWLSGAENTLPSQEFMLFDLEKDIGETEDLAKAMPGVVQQLAARMDELGQSTYQPDTSKLDWLSWCIGTDVEYEARYGAYYGPKCVLKTSSEAASFKTCVSCGQNATAEQGFMDEQGGTQSQEGGGELSVLQPA